MTNPRHGKEQPLFNTRLALWIIAGLAVILGVGIFWFFFRPLDVSTISHVAPHVKPTTGKIIARAPQIKHKALTAAQLHVYHARHVAHVMHLHVLHVKHLMHLYSHEVHMNYLNNVYG